MVFIKSILVPRGCRSDIGLSAPVIKRLKEHFEVTTLELLPQDFRWSYGITEFEIKKTKPDLIFITGDRVEMCAAAAAAFHNKVKIAHFYAGVVNDPITTFDDVDRHCITLWSDIQFCENFEAWNRVMALFSCFKPPYTLHDGTAYVVGISHLDDLVVDESKVPKYPQFQNPNYDIVKPYDLVLLNSEPLSDKDLKYPDTINAIIQIGGNPDGIMAKLKNAYYYPNLPRPQFLGLLKNCQRFITNSSAGIYEAPHFLKPEQIIMVGDRNKNRPRGPFKTGASDRIVSILREYLK